jgi:hypothetical protein
VFFKPENDLFGGVIDAGFEFYLEHL